MRASSARWFAVATIVALGGCARMPAPGASAPTAAVSDRLYFGRNIPTGGTVSDSAWATFLGEVVTPRFPDGFTVFPSQGQWKGADGAIAREAGFVLEVHHPAGQPPDSTFEHIAEEYCRRFNQEAVLRVRSPADEWMYRAATRAPR